MELKPSTELKQISEEFAALSQQNQKLEQDKLHFQKLQDAIFQISAHAFQANNMESFYRSLHKIISELIYAENFYIALLNSERQVLEFVYFVDQYDKASQANSQLFTIPVRDNTLTTYVFRSNSSKMLNSDQIELLAITDNIQRRAPHAQSWLGAPLTIENKTVGVIAVQSYQKERSYEPWQQQLFEYMAQNVAMTLEIHQHRLQLEKRFIEKTHDLQKEIELRKRREATEKTLLEISELANSKISLNDFYQKIHEQISRLIYAKNFYIATYDKDTDSVQFVYYVDTKDELTLDDLHKIPVETIRTSLTGYILSTQRPLLASKEQIRKLEQNEAIERQGPEPISWLGLPLSIDEAIIGVMTLQSYTDEITFDDDDLNSMEYVSRVVATAVQRKQSQQQLEALVKERTNELDKTNQELVRQIQEKTKAQKLQSALYEIANLASGAEDMNTFYRSIHAILGELFYAKNFFIALHDRESNRLMLNYFVDEKDQTPEFLNFDKNTLSTILFHSQEPLLLQIEDYPEFAATNKIHQVGSSFISWLGVPLKNNGETIGIMVVQSYEHSIRYYPWHKEIMEYVSKQVTVALQRKQAKTDLERKVQERTAALEQEIEQRKQSQQTQAALYHIANLANYNLPLEDFYREIHKIIGRLLYCENFYIALKSQDEEAIEMVYYEDTMDDFDLESIASIPMEELMSSLTGYVLNKAESVILTNKEIKELAKKENLKLLGVDTVSWMGVPLLLGGDVIGIMTVQSYEKDIIYSDHDRELMNFVGQHVASAIQRKRSQEYLEILVKDRTQKLQQEIKQRKETERLQNALYQIAETPMQCETVQELYSELHVIIADLMYANSFYIALVDTKQQMLTFDYFVDDSGDTALAPMKIGDTLTGYVVRVGKTVHLSRSQIKQLEKQGQIGHIGNYAVDWVGVPLHLGDELFGIMVLQSYDERYVYGKREVDILNFVSTHIAEALQRKQAEDNLRKANELLEEKTLKAEAANEAKSRFLATVSHEIRTPMNGILGILSLMGETKLSRRQSDYIHKLHISANSLLTIINDILDFSKIEQGKLNLESTQFNLLDVLDNMVDMFASRIVEKRLSLNIDVKTNVQLNRSGDPLRLSQILINLIGNAIKFTESGYIFVEVDEPKANQLLFRVMDSGIGIPKEKQQRIFDSFTQADDTTTRKYGGSGLGLSICQQLVTMMGGDISVSDNADGGSVFEFNVAIDGEPSKSKLLVKPKQYHIVLVSENDKLKQSWRHFLEILGVKYTIVHSNDLFKQQKVEDLISSQPTHLFIDEDSEHHHGLDILEHLQQSLDCEHWFFIWQPSQYSNQLTYIDAKVQLLQKPLKMARVLSSISGDSTRKIASYYQDQQQDLTKNLSGRQILLAEDNQVNQMVARGMLEKAGAKVTIVDNGQKAIDMVKNVKFDLVLMDMQMPVMDGYSASDKIRELYTASELPIIAMTANVMKGDKEKCLKHGMNDYIGKPVSKVKLLETINNYITSTPREPIVWQQSESQQLLKETENSELEIDFRQVAEQFENESIALYILEMFYESHANDLQDINSLLANKNYAEAAAIVHSIKGSAADLHFTKLQFICEALYKTFAHNQPPTSKRLQSFSHILQQHLDAVEGLLKNAK